MIDVVLTQIQNCEETQKKAIRDIRNQENVRKYMYTGHEITIEEHLTWLEKVSNDPKQIVFLVLVDHIVRGVVSLSDVDKLHLKSDWAFYLDENLRGGLGAALEYRFIDFVFKELGLEKLNCEVVSSNNSVVKLHKKFGFKEEGLRQKNIVKDGKRIGVIFLGITKYEWEIYKSKFLNKYEKVINKFDILIKYKKPLSLKK